mgnify:CR=1 FL=1
MQAASHLIPDDVVEGSREASVQSAFRLIVVCIGFAADGYFVKSMDLAFDVASA